MNFGVYGPNSGRIVNAQLKVLIADITLTNSASFERLPIPPGYDHLEIIGLLKETGADTVRGINLYYNGDTTDSNYRTQQGIFNSTSASAGQADGARNGVATGTSAGSTDYAMVVWSIPNASSTKTTKTGFSTSIDRRSGTDISIRIEGANWESTEPIREITLRTDNHPTTLFTAGSRLQIYGLGTFAVALAR